MTRGRCGSLLLQRNGLTPSTPCRFNRRTTEITRTPNTRHSVVEAIVSSPEDQAATTWKRVDSRPWLNTDGTPVRLRVANVDREADRYDVELAEDKEPRDPYDVWTVQKSRRDA